MAKSSPTKRSTGRKTRAAAPRCGLCGKRRNLIRTDCCGQWICNDEHKYVIFSYALNSCHRNHDRYTLCAYHRHEGHRGDWKTCKKCRRDFQTEMYVWYGTNEFNFETLKDPPSFEPTYCSDCGHVIHLGTDGYTRSGKEIWCEVCAEHQMRTLYGTRKRRR